MENSDKAPRYPFSLQVDGPFRSTQPVASSPDLLPEQSPASASSMTFTQNFTKCIISFIRSINTLQVDVVRERLFINERIEELMCQAFPRLTLENMARLVPGM